MFFSKWYLICEAVVKIHIWRYNLAVLVDNFENKISKQPYKLRCVLRNKLIIACDIAGDLDISRYRCCELQFLDRSIIYRSNTIEYEQTRNEQCKREYFSIMLFVSLNAGASFSIHKKEQLAIYLHWLTPHPYSLCTA